MAKKKKEVKIKDAEDSAQLVFAVRIRGRPGMRRKILDTLKMLRMHKVNHGILLWANKSYRGMLNKCKDFIAFGNIDEDTLVKLLKKRAKIEGNLPLSDAHLGNMTKYKSIEDFAKGLIAGEIEYKAKDVAKLKPVFRLHPPRKGHVGPIKKHYAEGGTLGNMGENINDLIIRML